jgi:POT family proton-dependent oligopeptide transporter
MSSQRYPAGIPYIIGNEAAERFSYYGMRAILFVYMSAMFSQELGEKAAAAKATSRVHLFFAGCYAFPMIGAILSDRLLGKYRTILWLSIVYMIGNAAIAFSGGKELGLNLGLALIAMGSGGIKPCVSAQVGDQFKPDQSAMLSKIYQAFYFSINFGSFFSTLLTPWVYKHYGPAWAFGIPGILMAVATFIMWAGRDRYIRVPPSPGGRLGALDSFAAIALFLAIGHFFFTSGASLAVQLAATLGFLGLYFLLSTVRQRIAPDAGFMSVTLYALTHQRERKAGQGFYSVARDKYGEEAALGPPAVLNVALVFSVVSVFWALFDQKSSSWIHQASKMDLTFGETTLQASQLAALNPAFVMLIIPLLNIVVYPALERAGVVLKPLRKMTTGMFMASSAFAMIALIQMRIDAGELPSVLWQVAPYFVMTTAEVLVSATGLEFAYTQAPRAMKSTITGFWLLTTTAGNLLVALLAGFQSLSLVSFFWVFAGLMALAAACFAILAYFYKERTA